MDALEISISRIIACFHQGIKTSLHQSAYAAAQNCLLAKEVRLGLDTEGGLQKTGARAADSKTVCKRKIKGLSGIVLLNRNKAGSSLAGLIFGTDSVARSLRSNHGDVNIGRRHDASEMNVEAVSEHQHVALFQVRLDIFFVQLSLLFIIDQDHDNVSLLCSFRRGKDFKTLLLCSLPGSGTFIETDDDVASRFFQVQRVGVSLAAVTDDCDCLAFQKGKVAIFLIINLC